ncbi:MAG TPA: hypothetical protein VK324_12260 [Tepidisphaeraceae bacterium]|nr:hypothetical protein [Tepidisphaeraceae bacterium]
MVRNTAAIVAWAVEVALTVLPAARAGQVEWPAGAQHWAAAGVFSSAGMLVDRADGGWPVDLRAEQLCHDDHDGDSASAWAWQKTMTSPDALTSTGGYDVTRAGEVAAAEVGLLVPFIVAPGAGTARLTFDLDYNYLGHQDTGDAVGSLELRPLDGDAGGILLPIHFQSLTPDPTGGAPGIHLTHAFDRAWSPGRYELSLAFGTGNNLAGGGEFDGGDRLDYAMSLAFDAPAASPVPTPTAAASATSLFAASGLSMTLRRPRRA